MWVIVVNTKSACNSKLGANFQCGSLNAFRPSIGYHKMHIGGHQEQRHDRRQVQRYQSQWWISSSWYTQNNSQGNAPISPTSFFLWISICGSVPIFLYVSNARVFKKKNWKICVLVQFEHHFMQFCLLGIDLFWIVCGD